MTASLLAKAVAHAERATDDKPTRFARYAWMHNGEALLISRTRIDASTHVRLEVLDIALAYLASLVQAERDKAKVAIEDEHTEKLRDVHASFAEAKEGLLERLGEAMQKQGVSPHVANVVLAEGREEPFVYRGDSEERNELLAASHVAHIAALARAATAEKRLALAKAALEEVLRFFVSPTSWDPMKAMNAAKAGLRAIEAIPPSTPTT